MTNDMTMESAIVRARARMVARLAVDLERIRKGQGPLPDELAAAPLIEGWTVVPLASSALRGTISGLPGNVATNELFVLDMASGFARTLSRYYRLGRQEKQ